MQNPFKYSYNNKRYRTLDYFYKEKFGKKVAKISLNANFTFPNKDGTNCIGGCIYCSPSGSGDYAGNPQEDIVTQFKDIKKVMDKKWKDTLYIGYFQANSNTYAPVSKLKELYEPILKQDNVVGLSIATRCDCLEEDVLDYLEDLNKRTYLTVELGLQSIHEKTAKFINRCHTLEEFETGVKKLRDRNIDVVVHIINGLPNETEDMMLETAKYLNTIDIQGVKIHMLHIVKNTNLAKVYSISPFKILSKDEYIDIVVKQLELLNDKIVIHRLTGDPDPNELIEPTWTIKKIDVLNGIDKLMAQKNTYQGIQS